MGGSCKECGLGRASLVRLLCNVGLTDPKAFGPLPKSQPSYHKAPNSPRSLGASGSSVFRQGFEVAVSGSVVVNITSLESRLLFYPQNKTLKA